MNILDIKNFLISDTFLLICQTFGISLLIYVISKLLILLNTKINKNEKSLYYINRVIKILRLLLVLSIVVLIWNNKINGILTIVGITSATIAFALRDVIFNLFSGIYIKSSKPFKVEDRIEVDSSIGDVININLLSFQILEVGDKEQSTGIIIQIPNSFIFKKKIKNYTKAIKYIWAEIYVNVDLSSDLEKTKNILYGILAKNNVLKSIPRKMSKAMEKAMTDYRIYYNHLEPIIYTQVIDNHIELSLRFLVHPKKKRYVISEIWNNIIIECKKHNIELYKN